MAKLLIVDDDDSLAKGLKNFLSLQGHTVETTGLGKDALQLLSSFHYDLIILDWHLPDLNGPEVCKSFRGTGGKTPIIFLTGQQEIESKELGLDSGADDYVVKPFEIRELSARIRSNLRRPTEFIAELRIGDVLLKPDSNNITVGSKTIVLRPKETALLEYLMKHRNKTFSAQELLDAIWSSESATSTASVRTWMKLLREQLADLGKPEFITTIRHSGYMVVDNE